MLKKFHPKPSEAVISTVFHNNFLSEVDSDVLSGVAVEYFGMDVREKFGDSRSNGSRDIQGTDFVSNERMKMTEFRLKMAKMSKANTSNFLHYNLVLHLCLQHKASNLIKCHSAVRSRAERR